MITFPAGTIVILRLKNNLELVGELDTETDEHVALKVPLQVLFKQVTGLLMPLLTLKDYMVLTADGVPIVFKKRDIAVGPMMARDAFAQFYKLNVKTSTSLAKFIDSACLAFVRAETPPEALTPEEREKAKQHRLQTMLEEFDVRFERPN